MGPGPILTLAGQALQAWAKSRTPWPPKSLLVSLAFAILIWPKVSLPLCLSADPHPDMRLILQAHILPETFPDQSSDSKPQTADHVKCMSHLQKSRHLYDVESSYPRKNTAVFSVSVPLGMFQSFPSTYKLGWGRDHGEDQIPSSGPHSYNPLPHHYDVIQGPSASEGLEK